MEHLSTSDPVDTHMADEPRPRIGRPPSNILKVTVSVRIPLELDRHLNKYGEEHGLLKGEVVTEALIDFFRLPKESDQIPRSQAASHR